MCQKVSYPDRSAALADIEYIKHQRRFMSIKLGRLDKHGKKMRPYECPYCDMWHLTTAKKYRGRKN